MRQYLRDNLAIVVGLTLPLLVALLFVVANRVPRALVEPPRHDLLLLSHDGGYNVRPARVDVHVQGGRLRVRAYRVDYAGNPALGVYSGPVPRLFLWSHESRAVRELSYELPGDLDSLEDGAEITVPGVADLRLSTLLQAPDGYEYRVSDSGGWFFPFFFERRSRGVFVSKDGANHEIVLPSDAPYYTVQFLAWVVD